MEVRLHPLEYTQRDLPSVCVVTGERAGRYIRTTVSRSLNPLYFVLLLLGPLGWLLLLFVSFRDNGTYIDLPVSNHVYESMRERQRRSRWLAAAVVPEVAVFLFYPMPVVFAVAWIPMVAAALWVHAVPSYRVHLRLDSVGLVTIRKAHPRFVAAVDDWRAHNPAVTLLP